jgi:hypothetical protein
MTKHEATLGLDKLLSGLIGKIGTSVYRIASIALLGLICGILKWYGPEMGHTFIASAPAVIQAQATAASAATTAADAKVLAAAVALDSKNSVAAVSAEVGALKTSQDKMIEALKQLHNDFGTINTTMAVHGKSLDDIVNRLDRVERKQDIPK